MLKQPLFGEDSSPQKTSLLLSAIITLCAWIIFCLMAFFIKFKPQTPEYKEVQIVLASTPIEEKRQTEEAAAMATESAVSESIETPDIPDPVETPVAEAKVEAPKETPAPAPKVETKAKTKSNPKTTETPADKKVPEFQSYGKTVEEQMEEQFGKKTKSVKDIDEIFASMDDSEPEPQVSQKVDKVIGSSGVSEESAGETSKDDTTSKTGGGKQSSAQNKEATDATINRLKNIASTKPFFESTGNIDSAVMITTAKDANGYENIKMSDGSMRVLLRPAEPNIKLSEEAAAQIDGNVKLTIGITVLKDGPILLSKITISPVAAVNDIVKEDIKKQLSEWLFEPSPDGSTATATFNLTINKN